jgi:hypothetical protein
MPELRSITSAESRTHLVGASLLAKISKIRQQAGSYNDIYFKWNI